jgi:hypothetical protein
MRPRNQAARDQLTTVLARRAAVAAGDLATELGVSVPTLHRMLADLGDRVVTTGKARRTRHALRRSLRGDFAPLPLYEVGENGRAEQIGELVLVHPHGSCLALGDAGWPVPEESRDGWWDGLPYPINDMRPQGYMGRQLARAEHASLGVSPNPHEWSDDDVVHVLSRGGTDVSGNLILGNPAFERWQAGKLSPPVPLAPRAVGAAYAKLAAHAVDAGVAGSSAAGEFPKFAALRELPGSMTPHVLVKFSGAESSATVRRWSDLLIAEHLALECAAGLPGGSRTRSRILEHAGRTFLEVERFDRHGSYGRSRLASLATLDAALVGAPTTDWTLLAARFAALGLLEPEAVSAIQHRWWFGRLIANTDMHTGNLSFRPYRNILAVAPVYDMLPMHYAPLAGGELPTSRFEPALPLPSQRSVWEAACAAAIVFWDRASTDDRIGAAFRKICGTNADRLREAADRV